MKRLLLLTTVLFAPSSIAMADHIGLYADTAGSSCYLGPAGFTPSTYAIHQFTSGATGSDFKIQLPAGSNYFAFDTPYADEQEAAPLDISLGYGGCIAGSLVLGRLVAVCQEGVVAIVPASVFTSVVVQDCSGQDHPASAGLGNVGEPGPCNVVATEQSTWGSVKALYR